MHIILDAKGEKICQRRIEQWGVCAISKSIERQYRADDGPVSRVLRAHAGPTINLICRRSIAFGTG